MYKFAFIQNLVNKAYTVFFLSRLSKNSRSSLRCSNCCVIVTLGYISSKIEHSGTLYITIYRLSARKISGLCSQSLLSMQLFCIHFVLWPELVTCWKKICLVYWNSLPKLLTNNNNNHPLICRIRKKCYSTEEINSIRQKTQNSKK